MNKGPRIVPFYAQPILHEPLLLYEGPFRLKEGDESVDLQGQIHFRWLPKPFVGFDGVSNQGSGIPHLMYPSVRTEPEIELPPDEAQTPKANFPSTVDPQTLPYTVRSSASIRGVAIGQVEPLDELRMNLINFWALDRGEVIEDRNERLLQIPLRLSDWVLRIQNVHELSSIVPRLEESSGYAFTQYCSLHRLDSSTFNFNDAKELLDLSFILFSLARGRLVAPVLPVGFAAGAAVFAQWNSHISDSWQSCLTWFPRHDPVEPLTELFRSAAEKWKDPFWQQVLSRTVRMYVTANHGSPVDTAIVTAQMGLELLTWSVLIEQEGWLKEADGRLNASGRLRLLLKWADIPTDVPEELASLHKVGRERDMDGPSVVTWVRNRLVHPDRRELIPPAEVLSSTWRLITYYLELCILRVIGYQGKVVNRLAPRWYGNDEMVPWASDELRGSEGPDIT
jgi:hypothetical protein